MTLLSVTLLTGTSIALLVRAEDPPAGNPPAKRQGGRGGQDGGPGGPGPGPGGGQRGGPGGFHLIPRLAEEKLNLTDEQKKQVADLEAETKAKLAKILTADQLKTLEEARPPRGQRPGGPRGEGGPGAAGEPGPGPNPGGPAGEKGEDRPPRPAK